jgi:DNA polymerase-4
MDSTILHVAIDSFAIRAERLRCPKLEGRPLALAPSDSPRPRVVAASREARAAGVLPGTPLVVARRLCRDLIALPPDRDLYAGLSDSIRAQLSPFAPILEEDPGAARTAGRFALNLTGLARTHADARDRAIEAGRGVERAFRLHPTLGIAATRLVSRVAATMLAPDGELLDVLPGSEIAFLAPLAVRVLPSARERATEERLDLLNARAVRDVQALGLEQLHAAFGGRAASALWREARGMDGAPRRLAAPPRVAIAEETLAQETNDRRALAARLARLAVELGAGLRLRGVEADALSLSILYADGREGRARRALAPPSAAERALRDEGLSLLDRAVARRVRIRRLRLEATEAPTGATQLTLWPEAGGGGSGGGDLERALDRVRSRFGTEALVPAAWMAHGLVVRPPARP